MQICCRAPHGARGLKSARGEREVLSRRRRAPHGARGLKFLTYKPARGLIRRAPHGARGLKFFLRALELGEGESRPSRGAWIEISRHSALVLPQTCRAPHGARGLKYHRRGDARGAVAGRAPHGARGLKFRQEEAKHIANASRPSRGAWIEIGRGRGGR